MNSRRDHRTNRASMFDGIEEGGMRASSSYSSHEIDECDEDDDKALDGLHDRVNMMRRFTGDVHVEVESHNCLVDRMGSSLDRTKGSLYGAINRFKMVLETRSGQRTAILVVAILVAFLIVYYLTSKNLQNRFFNMKSPKD